MTIYFILLQPLMPIFPFLVNKSLLAYFVSFFNVFKVFHCILKHAFVESLDFFPGTCRWGEFGEGGLLWGECNARSFEWFEGDPVNELMIKVQILFRLVLIHL